MINAVKEQIKSDMWKGWFSAILSAALAVLAFPPFEQSTAVWIFLVPLVLGMIQGWVNWRMAWVAGALAWIGTIWWVGYVTWPGMIILCVYLGAYWGAWAGICSLCQRYWKETNSINNLKMSFVAATAWVALDALREVLFSGFPWNKLGVMLYQNIALAQLASLGGVDLLTWLVVFVNVMVALTLVRFAREIRQMQKLKPHFDFTLTLILVGLGFVWGIHRIGRLNQRETDTLRIALVQGNIPQYVKYDSMSEEEIVKRYLEYSYLAKLQNPELIIWPETATGSAMFQDIFLTANISDLMREANFWFLTGLVDYDEGQYYNAAFLFAPREGGYKMYRKQHLVPFGEFLPGRKWFPWLVHYIPIPSDFAPGKGQGILKMQYTPSVTLTNGLASEAESEFQTLSLGLLICFEDVVSYLARGRIKEGARLLVNITNDAWFRNSSAPWQHAINSVFRCIENGVPMVRAANTGVSCVIDSTGKMTDVLMDETGKKVELGGFLSSRVKVPKNVEKTVYQQGGFFFPLFCVGICVLFWVYECFIFPRFSRAPKSL